MNTVCKKCGSFTKGFIKKKGSNTGLYCSDCGAWIKWLNKDEIRLHEHDNNNEETPDGKDLITRLKEFVKYLDESIDKEYENESLSVQDNIRKCAYCLALERDKNAIINMLNGKDFMSPNK